MNWFKSLLKSFGLKCPRCQTGALFSSYLQMNKHCPECGLKLLRVDDIGGPMLINYSVTGVTTLSCFFIFNQFEILDGMALSLATGGFAMIFMLIFIRYAKSMWVSFLFSTRMIEEFSNIEEIKKSQEKE